MIIETTVNNCVLRYSDEYYNTNLGDYYDYIVSLIIKKLNTLENKLTVSFGETGFLSDINIDFQYEHTIVKNNHGGFDCRIDRYNYLKNMDIIIDYSSTNVNHILLNNSYDDYSKKNFYIPPNVYGGINYSNISLRIKDVVAIQSMSERRSVIYEKLKHDLMFDKTNKESIKNSFQEYKILLNVHQTNNHLTFEELRCLPLLSTGILIISEDVPYRELIPYHKHIIWAKYEDIYDVTKQVLLDYEYYRVKYLSDIETTFLQLDGITNQNINSIFNYD